MKRDAARTASTAPPLWKSLAPPRAALELVVVIPVRSEAARLPATLAALAAQVDGDGLALDADRFEVIVLANNCTDNSAQIVRRFAARHPRLNLHVAEVTFPPSKANVGHARGCLMDEACRRLHSVGRMDGIIASTDGDTRAAPDWLATTLQEMRHGVDAVGGRIEMDNARPLPHGLARLAWRDAAYQRLRNQLEHLLDPDPADPWPRHHQHFGASLAVTVAAYLQVGGLPAKPFLEDEALYQALRAHDLKVRHSHKVKVVTSNRRSGRVAVGLSWQLRKWSELASSATDVEVDDPAHLAQHLMLRRRLRDCWAACRAAADAPATVRAAPAPPCVTALAASLQVPPRWLRARLRAGDTFGKLWPAVLARRQPMPGDAPEVPRMPMRKAIALLRSMAASLEDSRSAGDAARAPAARATDAAGALDLSDAAEDRADTALGASR